jgi:hypothetical protein
LVVFFFLGSLGDTGIMDCHLRSSPSPLCMSKAGEMEGFFISR